MRENAVRSFGNSPILHCLRQRLTKQVNCMKTLISALVSAVVLLSAPAFAASHAGGKMADKVDCTKKENADKEACKKK